MIIKQENFTLLSIIDHLKGPLITPKVIFLKLNCDIFLETFFPVQRETLFPVNMSKTNRCYTDNIFISLRDI